MVLFQYRIPAEFPSTAILAFESRPYGIELIHRSRPPERVFLQLVDILVQVPAREDQAECLLPGHDLCFPGPRHGFIPGRQADGPSQAVCTAHGLQVTLPGSNASGLFGVSKQNGCRRV